MATDTGAQGTPVDLGQQFGEPRDFADVGSPGSANTGDEGRSTESASPLSASRGGADPENIGPGDVLMGNWK